MSKTAFITGITGQDGSYLAELLLSKGYKVHGMIRRSSSPNTGRIDHIKDRITLHYGDMTDSATMSDVISIEPDEVYNLAAQSHVGVSFDMPEYTGNITGLGAARLLEAIWEISQKTKFYQASSSELFGCAPAPQGPLTAMRPQSPYAIAKLYAYWMTRNYRDRGLYAVNGIMFNHESPRRGDQFVTRKITKSIARILAGKQEKIVLGNLDAKRDWGFAPDYVEAMWRMLQMDEPDDYIIGTEWSQTIWAFLASALDYAGLTTANITTSAANKRPTDVPELRADATREIGWRPTIYYDDLVKIMVDADMRAEGLEPIGEGDEIIAKKYPDKWWEGD
jgi:GDPmannose 4,6-dehydratase